MGTRRSTVQTIAEFKTQGRPIVMLTAYDYVSARLADAAGVDILLVGDSVGTTVQGLEHTLPVTLDEMLYHTRLVARGTERALVVSDLPFLTYHVSVAQAIESAGRCVKEAGAQMVKVEGGHRMTEVIEALVRVQIPVMGHIGLTPQSVHAFGGYRVQRAEEVLLADARAVEQAGASLLVVEGVPAELGARITDEVRIPTIGIGAGKRCDGQVLVWHDLLGLHDPDGRVPRFVKAYANLGEQITRAISDFATDVRERRFPGEEHEYK